MYALVDMNSFYASAETVFRPDLKGRPVIVLSNGDGCAVARSAEAKALGVKMGQPWFEIEHLAKSHGLVAFSSNYALYADMSARVMEILRESAPRIEVYSIDESFLDLTGIGARGRLASEVRERIYSWVGLPCCVGIGLTKTRAKLANHIAKKHPAHNGVFDLEALPPAAQCDWLARIEVGEVWGVGPRLSARLQAQGVRTAADLQACDQEAIRQSFSVTLARTVRELQGVPCLELEEVAPPRQQIICSRTFSKGVWTLEELQEAVANYMVQAAEKLRGQGSTAQTVTVFAHTSFFRENEPQYSGSQVLPLAAPTADTRQLIAAAYRSLAQVYRPGFRYKKAGVMLGDLMDAGTRQQDLFSEGDSPRSQSLMATVDALNQKMGRGAVFFAGQGIARRWKTTAALKSPAYTTNWTQLAVARA